MTIVFNVFKDKIDILNKEDNGNIECLEIVTTIEDLRIAINQYNIINPFVFYCD